MVKRSVLAIVTMFVAAVSACQDDPDALYDSFRSTASSFCKDYCEAQVACERPSSVGDLDDDAFTAQVHLCITDCSAQKIEGAYVYRADSSGTAERDYLDYVDGTTLFEGLTCLYDYGAYRCSQQTEGYRYQLNPPTRQLCAAVVTCLDLFECNLNTIWRADPSGIGGTCILHGQDTVESSFLY